jgi:hypothetical protein
MSPQYRDIRPMLLQFFRSKRPFAFMPDLGTSQPALLVYRHHHRRRHRRCR